MQYAGASYDEYRFDFEIPGGLTLPVDSYYIEIVQTASSGGGQFLWASGEPTASSPGASGVSITDSAPGSLLSWQWTANWYYTGIHQLAMRLEGGPAAPTPTLALTGSCGGFLLQLDGDGFTPDGTVVLGYAIQAGALTLPGGPCAGTTLGLRTPRIYGSLIADATGAFQLTPANVPASVCGVVHVQAVDATSCAPSNVIAL